MTIKDWYRRVTWAVWTEHQVPLISAYIITLHSRGPETAACVFINGPIYVFLRNELSASREMKSTLGAYKGWIKIASTSAEWYLPVAEAAAVCWTEQNHPYDIRSASRRTFWFRSWRSRCYEATDFRFQSISRQWWRGLLMPWGVVLSAYCNRIEVEYLLQALRARTILCSRCK